MVVGGILGIADFPFPGVETGVALSIVALRVASALAWRPAEWVSLLLIGVFAVCHGYAYGAELPNAADPADYAMSFVVATGLIHLLGIGVGIARSLGALIALSGLYFLFS